MKGGKGMYCEDIALEKLDEIARRAKEWVNSPEGKCAIKSAMERAGDATKKLEKESQIDPKSVYEPMTI